MLNIRNEVKKYVRLLSLASEQVRLEKEAKLCHAPTELIEGFCTDLFHPSNPQFSSSFSEDELNEICALYGLLHLANRRTKALTVSDLQKTSEWREVMTFAKELYGRLNIAA